MTAIDVAGTPEPGPAGEAVYPLSPMQQGMLYGLLLEPGSGADLEQIVLRFDEKVDAAALGEAWHAVADRHELLRTSFEWSDGDEPRQRVHRRAPMEIVRHDVSASDAAVREARLDTFLRADRARGFDPTRPPLSRVTLFDGGDTAVVVWTFHHLLFDGRSFPIVLADLLTAYDAVGAGRSAALPAPLDHYRSYIEWLDGLDREEAETYWRAELKGFSAPTPLGVDSIVAEGPASAHRFEEVRAAVGPSTVTALNALASATGVTLNTVVQGAWALLLATYSGDDDIVFGTTRACRYGTVPSADAMAGLFINTLPLRVGVVADLALADYLQQVRATHLAMRPVEHTPLVDVQSWSEVPPGTRLFETILVYETYEFGPSMRDRLGTGDRLAYELHEQTNYPVLLSVYGSDEMLLCLEFETSRLTPDVADRMAAHMGQILTAMAGAAPTSAVGELDWLSDAESAFLAAAGDGGGVEQPSSDVVSRFRARATQTPHADAVVDGATTMTFAALDNRSDQIAAHLAALDAAGGTVAVLLNRSAQAIASMLGALKAGAAYLPLDPDYPPDRLEHMVADSGATVLVVDAATAERAAVGPLAALPGVRVLDVGAVDGDRVEVAAPPSPDDPCYIIYTSGSTGLPKGVVVPHRAVVNHADAAMEHYSLAPTDRVLQFAALSFDVAVEEIFPTLLAGASVVLRTPEVSTSFDVLHDFVTAHQITVVNLPAAFWSTWVDHLVAGDADIPSTIRLVVTGSEAVSSEQLSRWSLLAGAHIRWVNGYGPTETTVTATVYDPTDGAPAPGPVAPIGRPIRGVRTRVLGPNRRPVPIGAPGELHIGGAGVALGYHARPELTAERFIADPLGAPGDRLYRTGDLVRVLPDGNLEYLGRLDDQVKIRGFRVELGEIESALADLEGVAQAVVTVQPDPGAGPQLVGHLVLSPGAELDADGRREALRGRLPDYMVPVALAIIDEVPVTPSGKTDRRALQEVRLERSHADSVPPRTSTERDIAAIWADVLGLETAGVHDNFFELGGNSLVAIRLLGGIERLAGDRITLADLFAAPTIAELAARIDPDSRPTEPTTRLATTDPNRGWVIPIKTDGDKPPLFHLGGASVLRNLAHYLSDDRPLYALLEQDLDADHFATSVDEIVEHCIGGLRSVRPNGPYVIAGLCFGGVVALEMSRALRAQGEQVDLTLMIDSFAPGAITRKPEDEVEAPSVADRLELLRPSRVARKTRKRLWRRLWGPVHGGYRRLGRRTPLWLRDVEEANTIASDAYVATPYDGDVTLFIATEQDRRMNIAPLNGWGPLIEGRLDVDEVVGGHLSVYDEPHVRDLARKLNALLERCGAV